MQRLREVLTLALLALLPFHAFMVTVATKVLLGPGHAPMPLLAVWKELLLAVVLFIAFVEIVRQVVSGQWGVVRLDVVDGLIIILIGIALLLTAYFPLPTSHFLLGFKYDFLPLAAFMILRRVRWSESFVRQASLALLIVGALIGAYGILTFVLPMSFFVRLGYSAAHSLYLPDAPLAAFQQIGGTAIRRIQSTMSGPNQLGLWLVIPWSICMTSIMEKRRWTNIYHLTSGILIGLALFLTFSRAAWIAAFVALVLILWHSVGRRMFIKIAAGLGIAGAALLIALSLIAPSVFFRIGSNRGHLERPRAALRMMSDHPFGLGLSAAGPASNRTHEPCVFLEAGDDPSWAKSNPGLCVFVGASQVQPFDSAQGKPSPVCDCPVLPENWYLQIGIELGIVGMALFIALTILVIQKLWKDGRWKMVDGSSSNIHHLTSSIAIFLGLSVAALFLHAWEDAAVALTAWMLAAQSLRR